LNRTRSRAAERAKAEDWREKKGQRRNKRSRHQLVAYFEKGSGTDDKKKVTKRQLAEPHSQTGTLKLVVHTLDKRETRSGVCGWKEEK